jgi:nucleotidyltransferase substrate binding protein (TIGR01987 family)
MDKQKLLLDFGKALEQLEIALARKETDDLLRAGCIQYFEFTFELAWKTVKVFAEDAGLNDVASPRAALKQAFKQGWVEEETIWLSMLDARNRMAHTYEATKALGIYESLGDFAIGLRLLYTTLQGLG